MTKRVKYDNSKHEIDCFLDVLKADGVKECDDYLENWILQDEEAKVRDYLKTKLPDFEKKRALVHATSGNHNGQKTGSPELWSIWQTKRAPRLSTQGQKTILQLMNQSTPS